MQIERRTNGGETHAPKEAIRFYSTEQAADALHIKPQTLRAAVCRDGHYFGVRPQKARNRFLMWEASAIEALLNSESEVAQ